MVHTRKLTYGKTFNVGNYEAEHVRLEVELLDREYTVTEVNYIYTALRKRVHELQEMK